MQWFVFIKLFFEGQQSDITDGLFHWLYDDICEIVKSNEVMMYPHKTMPLSFLLTQTFLLEKLPNLEYLTHGDYACEEAK